MLFKISYNKMFFVAKIFKIIICDRVNSSVGTVIDKNFAVFVFNTYGMKR